NNRRDSDRLGKAVSRWDGTNSQKTTPNALASGRRKRRFLWTVDLNLRSLRYLLFIIFLFPLRPSGKGEQLICRSRRSVPRCNTGALTPAGEAPASTRSAFYLALYRGY